MLPRSPTRPLAYGTGHVIGNGRQSLACVAWVLECRVAMRRNDSANMTARKANKLPSGPTAPPVIQVEPCGLKSNRCPSSKYPLPAAPNNGALAQFQPV